MKKDREHNEEGQRTQRRRTENTMKKDREHNDKKKKIKLRSTKHYIKIQHRPTHDYRG
jgi:hypothetical protein